MADKPTESDTATLASGQKPPKPQRKRRTPKRRKTAAPAISPDTTAAKKSQADPAPGEKIAPSPAPSATPSTAPTHDSDQEASVATTARPKRHGGRRSAKRKSASGANSENATKPVEGTKVSADSAARTTAGPAKKTRRGKRGGRKKSAAAVSTTVKAARDAATQASDAAPPDPVAARRGDDRNLPFGFGIDGEPPAPIGDGESRAAAAKAAPETSVEDHPHTAEDPSADDAAAHARPVLKPRPPRRARGGRRRKKKTEPRAESTTGESADVAAKPVAPTPKTAATRTAKQADQRAPKSRRTRKKKTTRPEPDAVDTDDESVAVEPVTQVIDLEQGNPRPLTSGREMIINVTAGAECRIAILDDGRLEELYLERQSAASHVGNIYIGRITNVEPSIQAAFVDFGLSKNGFLHISDVLPKYFPNNKGELEQVGKKVPRRDRPPIQKCFRRGDKVTVQVVKEGVGTKGPTLTTYLSIPGRFMVMMPGMDRLGVSRKIEDDQDRRAMRELLEQLNLTPGVGFILRTAGLNRTKRELQSDLNYLSRLWKTVEKRMADKGAPCELYQESDLVIRTIRDVYSSEFKRIIVDDADTAQKAREFLRIAMPRTPGTVTEYRRPEPIFHIFGIEEEIERIHARHVPLPSGGSIVIDSTEAMVAIDVNSGKFRDLSDAEETAYRINLEAAEEIARQLRLRDLGGLVVCDFIDLRIDRHKRAVEKALRDALKKHKERARILRMSKFGLIEMTRQRQRQSITRSVFIDCPHCQGGGLIKAPESMSLEVIRILQLLAHRNNVSGIVVRTAPAVASLVLNERRTFIHQLELQSNKSIAILPNPTFASDQVEYECTDDRGMPLRVEV